MIVMFGASSDIGRRTANYLLDADLPLRLVSRTAHGLDSRAEYYEGDILSAPSVVHDADVVISCAHARFTAQILDASANSNSKLILLGSAWRYSSVREPRGDEVVAAEAAFFNSNRDGVMLHPTMIYGGFQENNLQRLVNVIRRWPVLLMPGGGRNIVQPIHVDDAARSVASAVTKEWRGPHAFAICGPRPMEWRDMARTCIKALGYHRPTVSIPLAPVLAMLKALQKAGLPVPIDINILLRLREDVRFSTELMNKYLDIYPREFDDGLALALGEYLAINRKS